MSSRIICLGLGLLMTATALGQQAPRVQEVFQKQPVRFEPTAVGYVAGGPGYGLKLDAGAAEIKLRNQTVRIVLLGSAASQPTASDTLPGTSNYILGNDPSKWRTGVKGYGRVRYANAYPGIDLTYYGNQQGELESDFELAPHADARLIRMKLGGAKEICVDEDGNLIAGAVRLLKPVAYQGASKVEARFVVHGNEVGFELGSYDHTRALVIDPILTYSTYFGGSVYDAGTGIAVDSQNAVYVTGITDSPDFPIMGGLGESDSNETSTTFVSKFNATGALVYSTYLGGSGGDEAIGIGVDSAGEAVVAGTTESTNFPQPAGSFGSACGAGLECVFVAKMNASGSALVYSAILGAAGHDFDASAFALDGTGSGWVAYVEDSNTYTDVVRLKTDGSSELFDFQVQGSNQGNPAITLVNGLAADSSGAGYVFGYIEGVQTGFSPSFPVTTGAAQTTVPTPPAMCATGTCYMQYLAKIKSDGSGYAYATYVGGSDDFPGLGGLAVDSTGAAYVAFQGDQPALTNGTFLNDLEDAAHQSRAVKVSPSGSAFVYVANTPVYPSQQGFGYTLSTDSLGSLYMGGAVYPFWTASGSLVLTPDGNPLPADTNDNAGFISVLDATGATLIYSTYWSGSVEDYIGAIAATPAGQFYVTGQTTSTDFPVFDPYQSKLASSQGNAFVSGFSTALAPHVTTSPGSLTFTAQEKGTTSASQSIKVLNTGIGNVDLESIATAGDFGEVDSNCSSSLDTSQSCSITVTFSPISTGTLNGVLTIINDENSPVVVSLTGTSLAPPVVSFSPSTPLSFSSSNVGTTTAAQTVTLTNTGGSALTPVTVSTTGDFGQTNNCPNSLAAGANCTIQVTFTPSAGGSRSGSLTIADNAAGSPQSLALSGTGVTVSAATLLPANIQFNSQTVGQATAAQTLTLSSTGSAALGPIVIIITGTNPGDFGQTNNCPSSLAVNANCTIQVTFTPSAAGARSASASVSDNAAGSPQTVALSGTGLDLALGLASGASNSQTITAGGTANYSLQVTPEGLTGAFTVSCTGAPTAATCTPNPSSFNLAGSAVPVGVAVTTTARSGMIPARQDGPWRTWPIPVLGTILLLMISPVVRGRRRRTLVAVVSAAVALLIMVGCGGGGGGGSSGGGSNTPAVTGTPAGTYPLTVTVNGPSNYSKSLQLMVVVN